MMQRVLAIASHELRHLAREPEAFIQMLVMPVIMIAFLMPAFGPVLEAGGHAGVSGAQHAVPGMVVMFSFFLAGNVAFAIFREHGWRTWDRLRASMARPVQVVMGKVAPAFVIVIFQQFSLFALGVLLFGLVIPGAVLGLVVVGVALGACFVSMGMAAAAVFRSTQQLNATVSVGAMAMSGLGGAFVPIEALPGWAQSLAPVVPTYWAMKGYRSILLDGAGVSATLLPMFVLAGFTLVFTAIAIRRFRFDEVKRVSG